MYIVCICTKNQRLYVATVLCGCVYIYIPFKIVSYARLAFLIISRSLCLSLSRLATHVLLSIFCGLVGLLVNCYVPAFQCVQVFGFSWGYRVHLLFQKLLLLVLHFQLSPRYAVPHEHLSVDIRRGRICCIHGSFHMFNSFIPTEHSTCTPLNVSITVTSNC